MQSILQKLQQRIEEQRLQALLREQQDAPVDVQASRRRQLTEHVAAPCRAAGLRLWGSLSGALPTAPCLPAGGPAVVLGRAHARRMGCLPRPLLAQVAFQLYEDAPQELRSRLWMALLEHPELVSEYQARPPLRAA